jgi:signal transduction histidine kinase
MLGYKLLYLASLIAYTFGAVTFSVLTLYYWRQWRGSRRMGARIAFPAFSLVCAGAFVVNLAMRLTDADALLVVQTLLTGSVPPLLFQLVLAEAEPGPAGRGRWRVTLILFYVGTISAAVARFLNDADRVPAAWSDFIDLLPALLLGAAAVLGLTVVLRMRHKLTVAQRRYRRWTLALLMLMLACSLTNLVYPGPVASLAPDYLVLAFFCVTLYYKERLLFFDLLIKRGAFLLVALLALTAVFFVDGKHVERLPENWSGAWISALLVVPLWLAAPWVYSRLVETIDRVFLRRKYSHPEAERRFIGAIQAAATEDSLRALAEECLRDIFQSAAAVFFDPDAALPDGWQTGLAEELKRDQSRLGWILVPPRPDSIPRVSADSRLLQSLARTLSVVLENVRFRERQIRQDEREQELRLLASRAELKALRAQINPHFLFNALNAIAGLIGSNPQLADETVEQLAQVFRYTLRKSENEWVRLDEEMEFVAAYLNVERARFGDRLAVEFDVDSAAGELSIPAMSVQPLVENAIKHGVSGIQARGSVRVRAALRAGRLTVEVFDNGPGFPAGFRLSAAGHGLRNVAERIAGYRGGDARLAWESTGEGTRVWMEMPVTQTVNHASADCG